jgi:hypothetical protein
LTWVLEIPLLLPERREEAQTEPPGKKAQGMRSQLAKIAFDSFCTREIESTSDWTDFPMAWSCPEGEVAA